jgi:hypothetical protein
MVLYRARLNPWGIYDPEIICICSPTILHARFAFCAAALERLRELITKTPTAARWGRKAFMKIPPHALLPSHFPAVPGAACIYYTTVALAHEERSSWRLQPSHGTYSSVFYSLVIACWCSWPSFGLASLFFFSVTNLTFVMICALRSRCCNKSLIKNPWITENASTSHEFSSHFTTHSSRRRFTVFSFLFLSMHLYQTTSLHPFFIETKFINF